MRVIYVDDEQPALDNFRLTAAKFGDVRELHLFSRADETIRWVREHHVDVAFLDMEMPDMHGLELARTLMQIDRSIRVMFVTAFSQYALDAFSVNAIGYVLKPYSLSDIRNELDKAARMRPISDRRVQIETIPDFVVRVDGRILLVHRPKAEELFALLIDRADAGLTGGDAIACLWPDKPDGAATGALFRNTFKRLMDVLNANGVGSIIRVDGRRRYVDSEQVDCDLYRILGGDAEPLKRYAGEYMRRFSWAEERNAMLYQMKFR